MPARSSASHLDGVADDHVLELTHDERTRIFNLGYYTWVEQQGVPRRGVRAPQDQAFWRGLADSLPAWDALIDEFNAEVGRLERGSSAAR